MASSTAIDGKPIGVSEREPFHDSHEQRFAELLTENASALQRLVRSYARPADRDDLLQEIALSLWRALPRFRGDCSERTYLFRIAHNCCITHISRRRPHISLDDLEIEPRDRVTTDAVVVEAQDRERLQRAVARLPVIYREVVVLMLEGLDYREIAEVVGITENNVGVRLNRARERLKKAMEVSS